MLYIKRYRAANENIETSNLHFYLDEKNQRNSFQHFLHSKNPITHKEKLPVFEGQEIIPFSSSLISSIWSHTYTR